MKDWVNDSNCTGLSARKRGWMCYLRSAAVLLIAIGVLALANNAEAATIKVSFETSEGFPDPDGASFNGLTNAPAGVIDKWTSLPNENGQVFTLTIDHGPGGAGFGDEPAPLTGSQIGLGQSIGAGSGIVEVDLNNAAAAKWLGFYYANRGHFPPVLTVEYFGLDELSLGVDTYTGGWSGGVGVGLDFGYNPKFQLITPTASFQGVALSKVIVKSSPPDSFSNKHGSFSMEDLSLDVIPEPSSFTLIGLSGVLVVVLRRWNR